MQPAPLKPAVGTGAMPGRRRVKYALTVSAQFGDILKPDGGGWVATLGIDLWAYDVEDAVGQLRQKFPLFERVDITVLSVSRKT